MLTLIAALSKTNHIIGDKGGIPWSCKDDLKYFQKYTKDNIVIMGRKTWDSLPFKPLKNRTNIVVSRNDIIYDIDSNGVIFCKNYDVADAVSKYEGKIEEKEIFIIGGSSAYEYFLPHADKMVLSFVDYYGPGDAFFPQFSIDDWHVAEVGGSMINERNTHSFITQEFYRKK